MQNACYVTDITDAQWDLIRPLLPPPASTGRTPTCRRWILNAILYLLKTGCQWRLLPKEFPPRSTVHGVFRAWIRSGILAAIQDRLRALDREQQGHRSRPTGAILDSQTVRSAGLCAEAGYDAGKKTKGRKRFLLVDTMGHLLAALVVPADVPERAGAEQLLDQALGTFGWLRKLWVDGGYSGPEFEAHVRGLRPKLEVEVVRRIEGTKGFRVLPRRWVVERTFGWIMQCRRLTRDYERLAESVVGWIQLVMIRIMLRRLA
jgi:transposase